MTFRIKLTLLLVLIIIVWPMAYYWYGLSLLTEKPKEFTSKLNEIEKCALWGKGYIVGQTKVTKINPYKFTLLRWQNSILGGIPSAEMDIRYPGHITIGYVSMDYLVKNNIPEFTLKYDAAMRAAIILISNNWSYEDLWEYSAQKYITSDTFMKMKKECEEL